MITYEDFMDYEQLMFEEHGVEITLEPTTQRDHVQVYPWPLIVPIDALDDSRVRQWIADKIKTDGEVRRIEPF